MATGHTAGENLVFRIDAERNKGIIEFELLPLEKSKSGKMDMLLSLPGFTDMGVKMNDKLIRAIIQIGVHS